MAAYELWVDTEQMKSLKAAGTGMMRKLEAPAPTVEELAEKAKAKEEIQVELRDLTTMESFKAKVQSCEATRKPSKIASFIFRGLAESPML